MKEIYNSNLLLTSILILFFSVVVYLANGVTISAGDTIPNTLLAFNLIENHTLHFDAFRTSYLCRDYANCYFFSEANNGHLSSSYPIVPAIVTFPLYLLFYIYLKFTHYISISVDLTSVNFEVHRLFFEKLAASITTAITVTIFYLSLRLKFNQGLSLLSTFIFAFATNTWMTSSQGLWQHGISNLALIIIIFCLLKANRATDQYQQKWLLLAGLFCGLLPGIRPTSAIYAIATIFYSVFIYRFKAIFLLCGLITAIPSFVWNLYYFGNLTGGYSNLFSASPYIFTLNNFIEASLGTLISPSRGIVIFSPVVLFSIFGAYKVFKLRFHKDEQLIGCMTIAGIILLLSYCFYRVWWAGHSYGPRFMTDIMPIFCYLISYFLANILSNQWKIKKLISLRLLIFVTFLVFSILVQFVGAFGSNAGKLWNAIPLDIDRYHYRLWTIEDNQIERNYKAVLNTMIKLPIDNQEYIKNLDGIIKEITDKNDQQINSIISVLPGSIKIFKANIENTGLSKWFGYNSAIRRGETRVRGRFFDEENNLISEVRLYIAGNPQKNELANAIGAIHFPQETGKYQLNFDLIAEGMGEFPVTNNMLPYVLNVNVVNQT
ncbi:protein O-mannosyl-transferase family [Anabaena sp. CCY 0017]|uniref:protein O-mannosyl-transferase family n=1 Tax=Anabaena sp. CCY 0017 TaxID=3103866 RepID=UPI0039C64549